MHRISQIFGKFLLQFLVDSWPLYLCRSSKLIYYFYSSSMKPPGRERNPWKPSCGKLQMHMIRLQLLWKKPKMYLIKTCRNGVPSHSLKASVWQNPPCLQPPRPAVLPVPAAARLSAPDPCTDTWCPASPPVRSTVSDASSSFALVWGGTPDPEAAAPAPPSTARTGWGSTSWSASCTCAATGCGRRPQWWERGQQKPLLRIGVWERWAVLYGEALGIACHDHVSKMGEDALRLCPLKAFCFGVIWKPCLLALTYIRWLHAQYWFSQKN